MKNNGIRAALDSAGLSVAELEVELLRAGTPIPRRTLDRYCKSVPSRTSQAVAIADVLNIPLDNLIGRTL